MRKVLLFLMLLCCSVSVLWAQTRQVSGKVNNESGAPLVGVSIAVKGSTKGVVTDALGKFTISVPTNGNTVLVVSFIGFTNQELAIGNQNNLSFKLIAESKALDDVVVVGYGSVKKRDLTGAVGTVKASEIVRANPANATQALQGQVPGVIVTKLSNKPGALWSIAIRGENTITPDPNANGTKNLTATSSTPQFQGTEPLVVIDGIIGGKLQDINPADIETIDILKDASSTAIYGSRGANGVIIISSKRGLTGKPRVTLDSYYGIKTPAHLPNMQNAQQWYNTAINDASLNLGYAVTPVSVFNVNEMAIIDAGKSTDMQRELTQRGANTGNTLAISGGNNGTSYRVSGGYIQEAGMVPNTNYKKYNLNAALVSQVTKFLKVGITLYENYSTNPTGSLEVPRTVYRTRPTATIYYSDLVDPAAGGDLAIGPINGYAVKMGYNSSMNPLLEASSLANYTWTRNVSSQMGNAFIEANILKNLTFKTSLSGSYQLAVQDEYRGKYSKSINLGAPRASVENDYNISYTIDNQLSYNTQIGKHKFNVTALQSAFKTSSEFNLVAVTGLPYNSYWYNLQSQTGTPTIASGYSQRQLSSFMGRVNYTFNEKYLFTFTGRSDGASVLASDHKYAFFPSGAFAWRLGEEKFVKKISAISDLKLRLSYGQVGNSVVSPYSTAATLLTTSYDFQQTGVVGLAPNNLPNQDLNWERSQELNLGLNIGLFNNRINATIELYKRTTKDLIMKEALPTTSGFSTMTANVGKVSNKGIEILLNTVNITNKNFTWTTSLNFAKNINRVEELPNGAMFGWSGGTNPENVLAVGYPVKSFLYYKSAGIWQLEDSVLAKSYGAVPGSVRIVDQNNDGKITTGVVGKDDRVILGTQLPNFTIGMTNRVSFKNLDFSVMMYYRNGTMYKNDFLGQYAVDYNSGFGRLNADYWTRSNPSNTMWGMGVAKSNSDALYYEDASFLRISDITMGYNVPKAKLEKMGIDRFRFYFQLVNPARFTKFRGNDPEYNGGGYQDDFEAINYTLGVNVGF
jgi:TonB-linked SusC/RagA family outer membrane protein